MKKTILGIACAATVIFGTLFSLTEANAQDNLKVDDGYQNTHKLDWNYPDDPCCVPFAWDCAR